MSERMRLLIGYDGSDCADSALDDLPRAGLPANVEILVVSVAELWLPPPPSSDFEGADYNLQSDQATVSQAPKGSDQVVRLATSLAHQACERLQTAFPAWQVEGEGYSGSAARQILNKAEEWKPNMIVVGSRGRSGLSSILLGSVSQKIVTEARCSVRVARGRFEGKGQPSRSVRIVVGFDGFPDSTAALDEIIRRNWPQGSEVRLVTGVGPLSAGGGIDGKLDFANGIQEAALKELEQTSLKVSRVVKESDPKHLLLDEARQWNADSIFVGTCNLNRFEQVLLGSVASAVVTRAHCSVEVVRNLSEIS